MKIKSLAVAILVLSSGMMLAVSPHAKAGEAKYAYGSPGPDGRWITAGEGEDDFNGQDYFNAVNDNLVPLQGQTLSGHAESGEACSLEAVGYDLEHEPGTASDVMRGIFHLKYTQGEKTTDFYVNRADENQPTIMLQATLLKSPVEGDPYLGSKGLYEYVFLDCGHLKNQPLTSCTRKSIGSLYSFFAGPETVTCSFN